MNIMATAQVLTLPTPVIRNSRSRRAHLSPAELLAVLKIARAKSVRDWCAILIAYRHGMRASEVCNLRMADVDMRGQCITVRRLKGSLETRQPIYQHRGQPLLDEQKALRTWLRQREGDGSDYVFTSQKGGRLSRSGFFRVFQSIAAAAGLPSEKRHPHCLKHSCATHLIAGNTNLALVKQALGHKSISSTMEYICTTDAQAAEAVATAMMGLY
jgi:integrase